MTSQEERNEVCNREKKDFDKMQKRLTETALYEDGMTLQDMKELITILDESKRLHETSKSQSSDSSHAEESPPKTDLHLNNNETCEMNYANAVKVPTSENETSPKKIDEDTSKAESKSQSSPKEVKSRYKTLTEFEKKNLRRKRFAMNPFMERDESDDLNERNFPIVEERLPSVLWSKFETPSNELMQKMSDYLQELRDEWMDENLTVPDESELQWGSPIEVGTRNVNLEKNTMTRNETEPARERLYRASKRKATTLIENLNNVSDSEPEADDESALLKKRKHQQERSEAVTSGSKMQLVVDIETETDQTPSTSHNSSKNHNIYQFSDDEDIFEPVRKSKSPEAVYPRRVSPPLPGTNKSKRGRSRGGKTNFKGPRAKKSTENKSDELTKLTPVKAPAQDIVMELEIDEVHDISPNTEPKGSKMSLQEKTKNAKKKLEEIHRQEREKEEEMKLREMKIEEEKRQRQESLVKARLAEAEEKKKLGRKKEVQDNEMKKKWNEVINEKTRRKEKRGLTEEEIQSQLQEDDIVICEDLPTAHSSSSSSKNRVVCPICNQFFHENEIENHASGCNQFEEIEETSSPIVGKRQKRNSRSEMQICNICREYETYDNGLYLEHVAICAEEHRSRRDKILSGNQDDHYSNFSPERKNFNLRRSRH